MVLHPDAHSRARDTHTNKPEGDTQTDKLYAKRKKHDEDYDKIVHIFCDWGRFNQIIRPILASFCVLKLRQTVFFSRFHTTLNSVSLILLRSATTATAAVVDLILMLPL